MILGKHHTNLNEDAPVVVEASADGAAVPYRFNANCNINGPDFIPSFFSSPVEDSKLTFQVHDEAI